MIDQKVLEAKSEQNTWWSHSQYLGCLWLNLQLLQLQPMVWDLLRSSNFNQRNLILRLNHLSGEPNHLGKLLISHLLREKYQLYSKQSTKDWSYLGQESGGWRGDSWLFISNYFFVNLKKDLLENSSILVGDYIPYDADIQICIVGLWMNLFVKAGVDAGVVEDHSEDG